MGLDVNMYVGCKLRDPEAVKRDRFGWESGENVCNLGGNLRAPDFKDVDDNGITYEYKNMFRPSRESRGDVYELWDDVDDLPSLLKKIKEMDIEEHKTCYHGNIHDDCGVRGYIEFVLGHEDVIDTCILEHC